jgi:outer membrane cobalamin receptor
VGGRNDVDNLGNTVKISSHYLFNLSYIFALSEKISGNFKLKNLLDKNYEEIYGYGTEGRALEAGLKVLF